jgi:hypothetical protein
MESDAPLARAPRVVVLDAEASEDAVTPIVHPDGDCELVLAHRCAQHVARPGVQIEEVRNPVELPLRHVEHVERGDG